MKVVKRFMYEFLFTCQFVSQETYVAKVVSGRSYDRDAVNYWVEQLGFQLAATA